MKHFGLIIYGIFIIVLISSCKYTCPGFPDEDLKWIPYNINDTLRYSDSKDTVYFIVNDFQKSEPSSFRGFAMDVECDFEGHYYTTKSSLYDYEIKDIYSTNNRTKIKIQITETGGEFVFPYYEDYSNDSIKIRHVADSLINGIDHKDIYVIQKDTIKITPRISRVIKSSEKGVIEFFDFKDKRKWNLIKK